MIKRILVLFLVLCASAHAAQRAAIYDDQTQLLLTITNSGASTQSVYLATLPVGDLTVSNIIMGGVTNSYLFKEAVSNQMFNAYSAGRLWGGCVSVTGNMIYAEAGGGICKTDGVGGDLSSCPTNITDGFASPTVYVSWSATNLPAKTGYNIIFYDYSEGKLTNILKADMFTLFDFSSDFTLGRTYYDTIYGGVERLCGMNAWSHQRRNQIYHDLKNPVELVQGGVVSATGLKIAVTASRLVAEGYDHFTADAVSTNDNWNWWYETNSVWTYTATNIFNVADYNDITQADGLEPMVANRWRRDLVYLIHDGSIHVVMGQAQYTSEALARGSALTTPPDLLSAYGTIIAEVLIQKNTASLNVYNQNTISFTTFTVPTHNDLSGLQGGVAGSYYHGSSALGDMAYRGAETNWSYYRAVSNVNFGGVSATNAGGLSVTGSAYLATAGGSVGVGVSVPFTNLHVRGVSPELRLGDNRALDAGGVGMLGRINFGAHYDTYAQQDDTGIYAYNTVPYYADLRFRTTGAERMTIQAGGNVGIATTNPATLLDVNGASTFRGNANFAGFSATNVGSLYATNIVCVGTNPAPALYEFYAQDSASSVQLGLKAAAGNDANIVIDADHQWIIQNDGNGSLSGQDALWFRDNTSAKLVLELQTNGDVWVRSGNVSIGSNNPSNKLDVIGDVYISGKLTVDGSFDPPLNHLYEKSISNVMARVADEIPPSKYKGIVNAYIEDLDCMYWWQPSSGKWLRLSMANGTFTKGTTTAWTNNMASHDWATWYSLDTCTGDMLTQSVAVAKKIWQLKEGYTLDTATGIFYDAQSNVVDKAQAIEYAEKRQPPATEEVP